MTWPYRRRSTRSARRSAQRQRAGFSQQASARAGPGSQLLRRDRARQVQHHDRHALDDRRRPTGARVDVAQARALMAPARKRKPRSRTSSARTSRRASDRRAARDQPRVRGQEGGARRAAGQRDRLRAGQPDVSTRLRLCDGLRIPPSEANRRVEALRRPGRRALRARRASPSAPIWSSQYRHPCAAGYG